MANKRFVKIFTPPVMCPREVFAKIARDFQMIWVLLNVNGLREGIPFQMGVMLSIFRLGLFYNEVLLDTVI